MKNKYSTVEKPWGRYVVLEKKQGYWIKKLFVNKGAKLSLQSHKNRCEIWVVLFGKIEVVKGNSRIKLGEGGYLKINKKEKHRIIGLSNACVLEVALGDVKEKDIVRYQDDYDRV